MVVIRHMKARGSVIGIPSVACAALKLMVMNDFDSVDGLKLTSLIFGSRRSRHVKNTVSSWEALREEFDINMWRFASQNSVVNGGKVILSKSETKKNFSVRELVNEPPAITFSDSGGKVEIKDVENSSNLEYTIPALFPEIAWVSNVLHVKLSNTHNELIWHGGGASTIATDKSLLDTRYSYASSWALGFFQDKFDDCDGLSTGGKLTVLNREGPRLLNTPESPEAEDLPVEQPRKQVEVVYTNMGFLHNFMVNKLNFDDRSKNNPSSHGHRPVQKWIQIVGYDEISGGIVNKMSYRFSVGSAKTKSNEERIQDLLLAIQRFEMYRKVSQVAENFFLGDLSEYFDEDDLAEWAEAPISSESYRVDVEASLSLKAMDPEAETISADHRRNFLPLNKGNYDISKLDRTATVCYHLREAILSNVPLPSDDVMVTAVNEKDRRLSGLASGQGDVPRQIRNAFARRRSTDEINCTSSSVTVQPPQSSSRSTKGNISGSGSLKRTLLATPIGNSRRAKDLLLKTGSINASYQNRTRSFFSLWSKRVPNKFRVTVRQPRLPLPCPRVVGVSGSRSDANTVPLLTPIGQESNSGEVAQKLYGEVAQNL